MAVNWQLQGKVRTASSRPSVDSHRSWSRRYIRAVKELAPEVGLEPTRTTILPSARWLSRPAAICERPALWTQTNRTSGTFTHHVHSDRLITARRSWASSPQSAPHAGAKVRNPTRHDDCSP